ncbi:MAG: sugar phosphate isomerase/epimerase [Fimbriimonadaceae bacterium]|nr:sugar phosphate isomerase/epimerase [Fimbriimonadaceae bacterium]MCE2766810.1 sugar phosphate isomerase/epimerase [Fimbriimonadaceae bacterium]
MIRTHLNRREFLVGAFALVPAAKVLALNANHVARPWFEISLAEWSLHRTIFSGKMTNLDFPKVAKQDFGIDAIEYVNQFFKDKANDKSYLKDLKDRCKSEGVKSVLIMCDGEGATGDPDQAARMKAVENHYKWVDAARFLGCHSIRVNAYSKGTPEEQARLCADGLAKLGEYASKQNINVIVENHGGLSSRGDWLTGVMQKVNMKNVGTLPDFGNFYEYDRYKGVEEMMPFAKGVSAKTHDFGPYGDELFVDYTRLLDIVKAAGYRGRIGIEFEGDRVSEADGIRLTKALLERVRGDKA